jgi:hypothetical protein
MTVWHVLGIGGGVSPPSMLIEVVDAYLISDAVLRLDGMGYATIIVTRVPA